MSKSVYVLEPQAIFIPELSRIVAAAGGHVVRSADSLEIMEIVSLRADYAILDLDYTIHGAVDGLAFFRSLAGWSVTPLLLTEERDFNQLARYRNAGAAAVLPKTMTADELRDALGDIFRSGAQHRLDQAM
jgi:DNA-binding NarL/FixJ family response regulator